MRVVFLVLVWSKKKRMRFEELSDPLEERIAEGLGVAAARAMLLVLNVKSKIEDEDVRTGARDAATAALAPGTAAFRLLMLALALRFVRAVCVQHVALKVAEEHERAHAD